jgi:hypothetical protein
MSQIELLEEGNYYHIYNRGINGENIFRDRIDNLNFIQRLQEYSKDVMDVFAYSLMLNHFHSLVYVRKNVVVQRRDGNGSIRLLPSKQLGHLFNGYAQFFNKAYQRTGGLFERPFKRKYVESVKSLTNVLMYIHRNPQHHGFVKDFRKWSYTSYQELISDKPTFLKREEVMEWFGGREEFIKAHEKYSGMSEEEWMIE